MPTARQIAQQRRELRKEIERDRKAADRKKLRELREYLQRARKHRRHLMRKAVELCRRARRELRDRAKEIRRQHREAANREIEAQRMQGRTACEARKEQARAKAADSAARATARYEAERRDQYIGRLYEKPAKLKTSSRGRARRAPVALHESDDEVLHNIPNELVPVWLKVRTRIKGTPRRTRTEAFLEWAQENAGEVIAIQEEQFARDIERMEREEYETRRRLKKPRKYRPTDRELDRWQAAAPEVPF